MKRSFPEHWVLTELGNILYLKNGYSFKSTDYCEEGIPLVRISDIQDGRINLDTTVKVPNRLLKSDFIIENGDLLIAMSGATTGKFGIYIGNETILQNQRVGNLKLYSKSLVSTKYRDYLIASLRDIIQKSAYGGAQPNISPEKIHKLIIPLPPLNEQKRIVAKLDAILPKVKSARDRLEKIPAILKKFRQSVLAAACSGKLTEDWREEYAQRTGKELSEWEEVKLESISELITKGASPNWQGIKYTEDKQVLFITSENVYPLELKLDIKKYVEFSFNEKQKRSILKKGDLLTNIVGASIGRSAHYNMDDIANVNQAVAIIRLLDKREVDFFLIYLNSPDYISILNNNKVDVARANISLTDLKNMLVPRPPLEEQQEIVRRVEKLFALADSIEEKYKKAYERVEKLEQAILAKAFRGELVEPDPNDEPAEELLKRILEEKAKLERDQRGKKRKK